MSMLEFLQMVGTASAEKDKPLGDVGERHGWKPEETLKLLRGEVKPTAEQLKVIADELGMSLEEMRKALSL